MKTILILASNPREDLHIDREIRDLTSAIERSKNSDEYEVVIRLAVRPGDLHDIFDRHPPHIVHFSGHGEAEAGLVLESDESGEQIITNKALSGLFNLFAKDSECVLLNACSTNIQADTIKQYVPYVIGTNREILDRAAYLFSVGFYTALGNGESIEVCFARGCNAIELELNNLDLETDIEEVSRKGIVVHGTESSQEQDPLKIILKRNSSLINQDLLKNVPPASPEFAAKIRQEVVRKKYKNKLRDVLDNFGQTVIKRDKPISKFEYEQRQTFLDKVQEFWINGFLKPSLYFNTAVDTTEDDPSGQILRPLDNLEVIPFDIDASYNILQRTGIITNETGDGKTLLILGEPGSGKTIALLQLAERLIKQTRNNMEKPIPVVFNLSSWGEKRQPLRDWLIEELKDKYQVPKAWSEPWIRDCQLSLLLDGLDEVKAEYRDDCIIAINQFLADRIDTEIIVCSRIKDYDALKERIALSSVICIQPLSRQQVLDFLKNVDDSLIGLKTVIEKDREIADFARTPLILNMMTWTYHGWSTEQCQKQFRIAKDRKDNLFDSYLRKCINRKDIKHIYPDNNTFHWLGWLARTMIKSSKTIFLIEKIQPDSLSNKFLIFLYQIFTCIFCGASIGIISGYIITATSLVMSNGIIFGIIGGSISGIISGIGKIETVERFSLSWNKICEQLSIGFKSGFIGAILNGVSLACISTIKGNELNNIFLDFTNGLFYGLVIGLIGGFLYGIISGAGSSTIKTNATPNIGIYRSGINALASGIFGGFLGFIIFFGMWICIQYSIKFIFFVFSLFVPVNIYLSSINFQFSFEPTIGEFDFTERDIIKLGLVASSVFALTPGFIIGLISGVIGGGGKTCFQHITLRFILNFLNLAPWNYARFLNYAAELRLMKRIGGGYVFYHRMLMEHFANMELEK